MPQTVLELFKKMELSVRGPVKWGDESIDKFPGIYVVAMNKIKKKTPIDDKILSYLIKCVSSLKVEGKTPTVLRLRNVLERYWLPDELILYIGKTDMPIRKRVMQYYNTSIEKRSPHHGGYWLKTLSILNSLDIYWAESKNPEETESKLLDIFTENVSNKKTDAILPFANLSYYSFAKNIKISKGHGISKPAI